MTASPRLTLRIDFANGARLGPGKSQLLALIDQHGSIRAAGADMGMSYRRAWLLADEINTMFQQPSIMTRHGGKSGGGACLTEFGKALLACCQAMDAASHKALAAQLDWLQTHMAEGYAAESQHQRVRASSTED